MGHVLKTNFVTANINNPNKKKEKKEENVIILKFGCVLNVNVRLMNISSHISLHVITSQP